MPARVASSSRRSPGVRRMPWKTGRPTSTGLIWARRAPQETPQFGAATGWRGIDHGVQDGSSRGDRLLTVGGPVAPPNSTVSQGGGCSGQDEKAFEPVGALNEHPVGRRPTGRTTATMPATPELVVVIGAGSIGQAIARRIGVGKTIMLADLKEKAAVTAAETLQGAGCSTGSPTVHVASHQTDRALA